MKWISDNIDPDVANWLFNIKIDGLPCGSYQRNVIPDLSINFEILATQLEETPEMIAFFDMLLAEQKVKVGIVEYRIRHLRGKIVERMLTDARNSGVEYRSTELKEIINTDPGIVRLEAELIKEQRCYERLKVVVESLIRKHESLRSLAGFKKEEMRNA